MWTGTRENKKKKKKDQDTDPQQTETQKTDTQQTETQLLTTLADFAGSPELKNINVVLVQELITEPGLYHAETDDWQLVFGKMGGEFRGEGIAHRKAYTHHRSKVLRGG